MTLHLGPKFTMPDEAAIQKFGILAMSGAGKSNAAVVMAEEFYRAGLPWVAIDPKGDWWGIRSGKDGKHGGLPVPVLGGDHGDVPLEPTAGKVVGNLIAERHLTCVLDVSDFDTKAAQSRFLTDLATTLLKRNTDPLHLFLEEADEYLPQRFSSRSGDATAACVGAWQRLVKRGRFKGLGVTLISQRSAALNKDALNQIDTLIAMRVTGPTDRKAIAGWIDDHQADASVVDELPRLGNGEAFVWSPTWLREFGRVEFRRRSTFDSGATPLLIGKAARNPATLTDVDLDALKAEMADTIERAKADDPTILRARIAELEREVRARPQAPVERDRIIYRPAFPDGFVESLDRLESDADLNVQEAEHAVEEARRVLTAVETLASAARRAVGSPTVEPGPEEIVTAEQVDARQPRPTTLPPRGVALEGITGGAIRILTALARFPGGLTRAQTGTQARIKHTGGTFGTYLSRLRVAGLVDQDGQTLRITDAGLDFVGGSVLPGDPAELRAEWAARLTGGCRRMYDLLVDSYPTWWDKGVLADTAQITKTGGTFGTYLSRLRSNQLVEERSGGELRAHPNLFM